MGKNNNKNIPPFVVVKVKNSLSKIDYENKSVAWVANRIKEATGGSVTQNNIIAALHQLKESGVIKIEKDVVLKSQSQQTGIYHYINRASGIIVTDQGKTKQVFNERGLDLVDGAKVSFVVDTQGRAVITEVEAKSKVLVGTVDYDENGALMFYPLESNDIKIAESKRCRPFVVVGGNGEQIKSAIGKRVTVETLGFNGSEGVCKIRKVFGKIGNPIAEFNAIADEAGVVMERCEQSHRELEQIPTEVDINSINLTNEEGKPLTPTSKDENKPNYVDLRGKMFCTIDPIDCQDMDDSVYTEIDKDGNFVTYAAIADVTEYVHPGMSLWEEAKQQGFTLYIPGSAFDMLPHELAAGICSLNPNVDRLTMCVKSVIDAKTGKRIPEQTQIMHAVINSKRKFSYNEVQAQFDKLGESEIKKIYQSMLTRAKAFKTKVEPTNLTETLVLNKMVADAVWINFNSRNNLKLSPDKETQFILNKDKKDVIGVEEKPHIPSMSLIEALMINANECVAEYTTTNGLNSLYRVHGEPNDFKVGRLRSYLEYFKIPFNGSVNNPSLQSIIDYAKGKPYEESINYIIKTMLDRAKYSAFPHPTDTEGNIKEDALCHNALQSERYTHFTSGIRRMCDLYVQYAIKQHLRHGKNFFDNEEVVCFGPKLSAREKAIDDADQKANDIAGAIYMEKHINDIVEGRVCSISESRVVFETKENLRIEIPMLTIGLDKTHVKNEGVALVDNSGQEVFKLGDTIKAKVCGADRVTGSVYANLDLTKTYTNTYLPNADVITNPVSKPKRT